MTEAEWLACSDPLVMLHQLERASARKLRLFAVACCRRVLHHMANQRSRQAVEVTERYAEGRASRQELRKAHDGFATGTSADDSRARARSAASFATAGSAIVAALNVANVLREQLATHRIGGASHCDMLRDIFGPEPFRPLEVSPAWFAWQGGAVQQMAQTLYDEGRFEDLPVLADALEEAGCTDWDILWHCRSGGEHVRGCWVLDLLLGKE